ncbi:MAG: ring-cleaving dioxygenase [Chloroflexi bacterium]|nr:ring-cleaving dioxygenase [Chloroflexota bacterium]NOG34535.1 ring-cleaving dioxygenase [Chloroflexota bacterium]
MQPIQGLHHITAVAGDPQANINFYHQVLGQRFVKKTVNFDDPGTYHFYFADEVGTPGTVLTFFPWQHMRRGERGNGETTAVAYTIAPDSIGYWQERLAAHGVVVGEVQTRFGTAVLPFHDPDGMPLELIASGEKGNFRHWANGPIPEAHALRGFHGVTLWLSAVEPTAAVLTEQMGYTFVGQEGSRYRYRGASADGGLYVDILHRPGQRRGSFGAGSIHHIAFRTVDDSEQLEYLQTLRQAGLQVTPVQDRQYFHSIYFREPGGVLFEVATDAPGFLIDETVEELGSHLKLPPWFEQHRAEIERALPPVTVNG